MNPRKHDKKLASLGGRLNNEREKSSLPLLPIERDAKQPAITLFFMKSLVKKGTKKDTVTPEPKEPKGKEKVTDVIAKQDMRKLLPRKLTRTTPNSLILDST